MSPLIISFPFSLKILIYLTKKLSFRFVSPKKFVSLRSLRTSQNNELNPSKEKKMHIDAMSCDWAKKQNRPVHQGQVILKRFVDSHVRLGELIELTNSYFSITDLFIGHLRRR